MDFLFKYQSYRLSVMHFQKLLMRNWPQADDENYFSKIQANAPENMHIFLLRERSNGNWSAPSCVQALAIYKMVISDEL
jgi:hypothetical protein